MSRLAFHRPARYMPPSLPDEKITLPMPPEVQGRQAGAQLMYLVLPLMSSFAMAGYMISNGRPLLIIVGILFVVVSIGAGVMMRVQMRNASRQGNRRQRLRYQNHIVSTGAFAREVAAAQRQHSAVIHPDPERLWAIASAYQRVWERRLGDPDFLHVRVGLGAAGLVTPIEIDGQLDPLGDYDWDCVRSAQRLINRMGRVGDQPAVVDLGACGVVSVLGPPEVTAALTRALLCQVAVLHAPDDVCVAVERSGQGDWAWVKWLPHVIEADAPGPAGIVPLVAAGPEELTEFLERELTRRQELVAVRRVQVGFGHGTAAPPARLIIVCTGFEPVSEWGRSDLLRALLTAAGPQSGITMLFLVEEESEEPGRVDLRLRTADDGRTLSVEGAPRLIVASAERCVPDLLEPALAELIARRLAPLRLTDEREQVLTRTISLTEMLLGGDPLSVDITGRWAESTGERLLRIAIGNDGEGEPVLLDIKEPAQGGFGPHGLIVGATGSGKSELLRTLVTGLALTHSPEALSFVLVDFKGGAAFAPLTDLPHVAGLITNLADDSAMIDRVQAALIGEQQRRQRMLRDAGNVDSIRDYQRMYASGAAGANGEPLEPLPYLLIIVDEFSELLSGRPEFVDLFVQIGRVGRSLGLHLLMATQRLEEGRLRGLDSHLSYRICLRTFSATESRTVIGTIDAYRLPPIPGSAYLKVDESIYRRFRVAHVSSPYVSADELAAAGEVPGSSIVPFEAARPVSDVPSPASVAEPDEGPTELAVVVGRLKAVGRPAHQVWLPPLPAAISLDFLTGTPSIRPGRGLAVRMWEQSANLKVPIGVLDLPLQQQQQPLMMDFGGPHGHLAVVGAPQTGRSTTLRTVMMAGMLTHTPEEMQFYCIDFGGGSLHQYAAAPHVGSVAGRTDTALVSRMLAEIRLLIADREVMLRDMGIDSIAEFRSRRAAGLLPDGVRAADVFLIIDNWGGVRSEFEDADAAVTDIAARGLGVGVHLVLTASRWLEIRPALRDSIGTRMELRLNDPAESEVNRRLAARMANAVPGRGIAAPGVFYHLVLPRLDGQETAEGVREAQDDILAKIIAAWSGTVAPAVRMLPSELSFKSLLELPRGDAVGVPIGITEADFRPVALDLAGGGEPHFLTFGDAGSGKTSFLRTFIGGLAATSSPWDVRVVLVDYRRSLLGAVPEDYLGAYAPDVTAVNAYVEQLCARLTERMPPAGITQQELAGRGWWEGPEIYLLIDDYDLVGGVPLAPLAEFIPHAREVGLHVVVARRVTGMNRTFSDQFFNRIRELGCDGLVLSGDRREGPVLGEERAAERPPGRGVLVRRGRPGELIHIALSGEPAPATFASAADR
jgi:S-DNA-T family DNA segregation ATPase FtsK/SpoIIIE